MCINMYSISKPIPQKVSGIIESLNGYNNNMIIKEGKIK